MCIAFLLTRQSIAQVEKKSPLLAKNKSQLWISDSFVEIEREFESGIRIIDETDSSGLVTSFDYFQHISWGNIQIGGGFFYLKYGKNVNKFERGLSLQDTRKEKINKFGNPFFEVIKKVNSEEAQNNHYLKLKIITSLAKTEHLYFEDRNMAQLSYIFSNLKHNDWSINSEIFTRYFGKIETDKETVGEETRESYTEVGLTFYPILTRGKFLIIPLLGFSFTTDYNSYNKYFSRLTDKGFSYSGGFEIQYLFDKYILSIEYFSSSQVFNTVSENPNNEIDNEIEKRTIKLSLGVLF